jgi:hypothetical protein
MEKSQAGGENSLTPVMSVMEFLLPEKLVEKCPEGSQEQPVLS